jgi:membrane protein implicated in regulation of membrane protease activity
LKAVFLPALILILVRWLVNFPTRVVQCLVVLWVLKNMFLLPFVWCACDRGHLEDANSIIGTRGITEERLAPAGYVQVHGELWQAEMMGGGYAVDRAKGSRGRAIRGLILLMKPDSEEMNREIT